MRSVAIFIAVITGFLLTCAKAPDDLSVLTRIEFPLSAPVLTAQAIASDRIELSWPVNYDATSYTIYKSTTVSSAAYTQIGTSTTPTFIDSGLSASTTYYYKIKASNAAVESDLSAEVSATTPAPPLPDIPAGVTAVANSSTAIQLSWAAATGAASYAVFRSASSGGTFTQIGSQPASPFTDVGLNASTVYYYKIKANNPTGSSDYSAEATATTQAPPAQAPGDPTGVVAASTSSTAIALSWAAVNGATSYIVFRSASSGGTFNQIGTPSSVSFTDVGLSASTPYYYKVKANNAIGASGYSAEVTATTQAPPLVVPGTPTGVGATAISSTSVSVSWTTVSGATSYKVFRAPAAGTFSHVGTSAASPYVDVGLTDNTMYFYKVSAVNSNGESGQSIYATVTTQLAPVQLPGIPTGVGATANSSTTINISWVSVNGATSYIVFRSATSGGSLIQIGTPATSPYADAGLTASTAYYYKVKAVNSVGASDYSNEATATTQVPPVVAPGTPTGVGATATSSTAISVSWTGVSGATSYKVYRSATSGGTYTQVGTPASSPYADAGLMASTAYYYKVSAVNSVGESGQSSYATATTQAPPVVAPGIPTGVGVLAASSTWITVSWTAVSGASSYKLYRCATSGGTYVLVGMAAITFYRDTGLIASTSYYYKVSAVNWAGESGQSGYLTATTEAPPVVVPGTPTGFGAVATSSTAISLSWTAVSVATSYYVYKSVTSGGTYTLVGTPAASPYADTGLIASTSYYYKVSAVNWAGVSGQSGYVTATTQAQPVVAPGVPTSVGATTTPSIAISISWVTVSGATSYKVYRSASSGGTYMQVGAPKSSPYVNTGLTVNTAYYYKVSAVNSAGESGQSSYTTATTFSNIQFSDSVTDIDGNVYHAVTIGTQVWTVENLKTTKFNDGSLIPLVTDSLAWSALSTPGYCWYLNNEGTYKQAYGALYNFYSARGNLAPAGWHVPTDAEWTILENFLIANGYSWDGSMSGNKIGKSLAAKTGWTTYGTAGTVGNDPTSNNSTGFSALPCGYRNPADGTYGAFGYQSINGHWWSATGITSSKARYRYLNYDNSSLNARDDLNGYGFSVRIVRDN